MNQINDIAMKYLGEGAERQMKMKNSFNENWEAGEWTKLANQSDFLMKHDFF